MRWGRVAAGAAALALAPLVVACTGEPTTSGAPATAPATATSTPGGTLAPGGPGVGLPPHPSVPSTLAPVVTTPEGGPAVVDFEAPETFRCMADGVQAQITVGWSAPSATGVTVSLDGTTLASGLQDQAPYQVPAGTPAGIGSTIVFACDGPAARTVTVEWAMGDTTTERTFTITEAEAAS